MHFLTLEDARRVLASQLDERGLPRRGEGGMRSGLFYFGDQYLTNTFWVALRLIETVGPWEDAYLWLHNPDTSKRDGLHLAYRLRQSYGELRALQEAPVHQFHGYERPD